MMLTVLWLSASGAQSAAQTYSITNLGTTFTSLFSFGGTDGEFPSAALIRGTDGNFYGTTIEGGAVGNGTVFKITAGGTLTTLHSFDGTDGTEPNGLIQATNGNFYGTTPYTVFKVTPSGTLTTLASVSSSYAALVQANRWELLRDNGVRGQRRLRRWLWDGLQSDPRWHADHTARLHQQRQSRCGADPGHRWEPLRDNWRGRANNDCGGSPPGPIGCGMVFKVTLSGTLTTLFSFDGADGEAPQAALVQGTNGEFYGTTAVGGASGACEDGCGTIFSLSMGLMPGGTLSSNVPFQLLP